MAAALTGVLLALFTVWGSTSAAFLASSDNPTNSFATASVTVSDNDAGTALFAVSGLGPNDTGTRCILVTYSGTVTAAGVRLYATGLTGTGLGSYLTLVVEEGTGTASTGLSGSCTGFAATGTLSSGTVAAFASAHTQFSDGLGSWTPAPGGTRAYRITYTVQNDTAAQGLTCSLSFTWEARG